MPEILIVDDEPHLREIVRYALEREGYAVREASDGRVALAEVARSEPDLMVLDVLMPELDGIEVCRRVRATSRLPIVFLSSRGEELDRVLGLELGGDDYVTKPFSPRELVSRVKAVLRRTQPEPVAPRDVVRHGALAMVPDEHRVAVGDTPVELTVTEFRMLLAMVRRPGKVYTREDLVEAAYEGPHFVADRTVDSHVRHIRKKLREAGVDPIDTVHGLGYRLARE
ncbi:MAG: response regulator transcription factor [Deltaproteobacteria bacterium]|nr:MAG: response regulator transcription factor [Deltaproteobacteria bacterium]